MLERFRNAYLLIALSTALVVTNSFFTINDDEVAILNLATQPIARTIRLFFFRAGQHEHPPAYDLLLHCWLRFTGGSFGWLRIPAIAFFIAGLWLLSRAAQRIAGPASGRALIWLGVLWPYGFHYARLACWYSFVFMVISALTLAYLQFLAFPNRRALAILLLLAFTLVCANYFGWIVLALLALDYGLRKRHAQVLLAFVALMIAYAPFWYALGEELLSTLRMAKPSWTRLVLNTGYDVYVLFAGESVAPWFWPYSAPVIVAIAVSLTILFLTLRGYGRRFFTFGALLVVAMALLGILQTKRLLLIAPWMLLALAVGVAASTQKWRTVLLGSLAVVAGVGWFGVFDRTHYAAPRFVEPWAQIAAQAAASLHNGSGIIGNNPSFFFYLTYRLENTNFAGVLPTTVTYPRVWNALQWNMEGHPLPQRVMWVRGMDWLGNNASTPSQDSADADQMQLAQDWLDRHCVTTNTSRVLRDPAYALKTRLYPELGEREWRIEVRNYSCSEPSYGKAGKRRRAKVFPG